MNTTCEAPASVARVVSPALHLPVMQGVIDRRMLVNFRVRPAELAPLLPPPFRPQAVNGWGMAGLCLIRLCAVRPRGLPAWFGVRSENAAHRIAVEWDDGGTTRGGVYIVRRDTGSWLNRLAGGRVFPGEHHAAVFQVWESAERFKLEMKSRDGSVSLRVAARLADEWQGGSVFASLDECSEFFRRGAVGWSPCGTRVGLRPPARSDGLELRCDSWHVEPLVGELVESSFFENRAVFPPGTVEFDNALLMRSVPHEWHAKGRMDTGTL